MPVSRTESELHQKHQVDDADADAGAGAGADVADKLVDHLYSVPV